MQPGLERVVAGMQALGLATSSLGMVHILGTNGKGSTAAFLEAIAMAHGRTCGVFTSPHLVTPRERIRMKGEMLSPEAWVGLANTVYRACPDIDFSYFELLTLMAMLAFVEQGVDLAIMEAGLGGTWDATSAFSYDLTLITPVGLDHEQVLGSTIEAIARDKAGAIHGGEVVCAPQQQGVTRIFQNRSREQGAGFHALADDGAANDWGGGCEVGEPLENLGHVDLGLAGAFQLDNARLALAGWSFLTQFKGWSFSPLKCMQGLAKARHPGRMQIIKGNPTFLLDGAHNVMGMKALAASLARMDFCPDLMIFSCMKDKNLLDNIHLIKDLCTGSILVPGLPDNDRAMNADQLATKLGSRAIACDTMQEALTRIKPSCNNVLVCGSLFVLGAFFCAHPYYQPDTL